VNNIDLKKLPIKTILIGLIIFLIIWAFYPPILMIVIICFIAYIIFEFYVFEKEKRSK